MSKHQLFSEKPLFLTDLDSTLIFSHRHEAEGEKIWVEELNGRQQSYMTERTHRFFREQQAFQVVPITTRRHAQYARLQDAFTQFGWNMALICNGAVLLRDGEEDPDWSAESAALSAGDLPELLRLRELAVQLAGEEAVLYTEPFFFFVRSDDAKAVCAELAAAADPAHIIIHRNGRKIYCIPQTLSKGEALKRFLRYTGHTGCIAAGDSFFDLSLLEAADIAFCPETLREQVQSSGIVYGCPGHFSEEICTGLERLHHEGLRMPVSASAETTAAL